MFSISDKRTKSNSNVHELMLREVDFSIENLKQKFIEKIDALKGDITQRILQENRRDSRTPSTFCFNTEAVKTFEKAITREIETLKLGLMNGGRDFQPDIVDLIEVPASIGFNYGANTYNQKHGMIIACPSDSMVYFYDAAKLAPMKSRKPKEISSSVVQMSYCPETDTHLLGCAFGDIYAYNATTNIFNKVMKEGDSFILAITHISPTTFAFSSSKSGNLYFGKMGSSKPLQQYSKNSDAWYLHHINDKKLLLSGLANGKIAIYSTNGGKENRYPMIGSVQAHKFGKYVTAITSVTIDGRQYIITGGNDHAIKVWHFLKGKMRLLKVIQNTEDVSTLVYLSDYKMIACTHHRDFIKFFKLPFGKLEKTLSLGLNKARNIFSIPDKNCLGVADLTRNVIRVVQLHSSVPAKTL